MPADTTKGFSMILELSDRACSALAQDSVMTLLMARPGLFTWSSRIPIAIPSGSSLRGTWHMSFAVQPQISMIFDFASRLHLKLTILLRLFRNGNRFPIGDATDRPIGAYLLAQFSRGVPRPADPRVPIALRIDPNSFEIGSDRNVLGGAGPGRRDPIWRPWTSNLQSGEDFTPVITAVKDYLRQSVTLLAPNPSQPEGIIVERIAVTPLGPIVPTPPGAVVLRDIQIRHLHNQWSNAPSVAFLLLANNPPPLPTQRPTELLPQLGNDFVSFIMGNHFLLDLIHSTLPGRDLCLGFTIGPSDFALVGSGTTRRVVQQTTYLANLDDDRRPPAPPGSIPPGMCRPPLPTATTGLLFNMEFATSTDPPALTLRGTLRLESFRGGNFDGTLNILFVVYVNFLVRFGFRIDNQEIVPTIQSSDARLAYELTGLGVFLLIVAPPWVTIGSTLSPSLTAVGPVAVATASTIAIVIASSMANRVLGPMIASSFASLSGIPIPLALGQLLQRLGTVTPNTVHFDDLTITGREVLTEAEMLQDPEYPVHYSVDDARLPPGFGLDLDTGRIADLNHLGDAVSGADLVWSDALYAADYASMAWLSLDEMPYDTVGPRHLERFEYGTRVINASAFPIVDRPWQGDSFATELPVFLAVRTKELRYAKCLIWRDTAGSLHVNYVVFTGREPTFYLNQRQVHTARELTGRQVESGGVLYDEYRTATEFTLTGVGVHFDPPGYVWGSPGNDHMAHEASGVIQGLDGSTAQYTIAGNRCVINTRLGEPFAAEIFVKAVDTHGETLREARRYVSTRGIFVPLPLTAPTDPFFAVMGRLFRSRIRVDAVNRYRRLPPPPDRTRLARSLPSGSTTLQETTARTTNLAALTSARTLPALRTLPTAVLLAAPADAEPTAPITRSLALPPLRTLAFAPALTPALAPAPTRRDLAALFRRA